jgi:uncharacterized protein (TIGR02996 family)
MPDEQAFLNALKSSPADDTTRLVYADWLDERGESAKAGYLRHIVELVGHAPGSTDYAEAAAGLLIAASELEKGWREAAGGRFDLVLVGYEPGFKIHTLKVAREITGVVALGNAKILTESVPVALFTSAPFEEILPGLLRFDTVRRSDPHEALAANALIRPTTWPDDGGVVTRFDVELYSPNYQLDVAFGEEYAREREERFTGVLAGFLGIDPADAAERLRNLPLTLATAVRPTEVTPVIRGLVSHLNEPFGVVGVLYEHSFRIVPRRPAS